jgi:hypothetical protein
VAKEAGTIKCGFYISLVLLFLGPISNLAPAVREETTLLLEKLCVDSISQLLLFLPLISNLAPAM